MGVRKPCFFGSYTIPKTYAGQYYVATGQAALLGKTPYPQSRCVKFIAAGVGKGANAKDQNRLFQWSENTQKLDSCAKKRMGVKVID